MFTFYQIVPFCSKLVLAGTRTIRFDKSSHPQITINNVAGKIFIISHQNAYCMMVTVVQDEIYTIFSVGNGSKPTLSMEGTSLIVDISSLSMSFTEITFIKEVQ